MLTLYPYPEIFGVADNNPFGLQVYAFLELVGLPASSLRRIQVPCGIATRSTKPSGATSAMQA